MVDGTVDLGSWSSHRCASRPVQQTELDACRICQTTHQAIEGVDFTNEMPLTQTSDGRVARHLADTPDGMGDEDDASPDPCGRRGRFAAGMAAADHDHVPARCR